MKSRARIANGPASRERSASGISSSVLGPLLALDARIAAVVGAGLVAIVGVPLATLLSIWIDEAFTLHTTGAGPLEAWMRAIAFEAQPPLYFFLEGAFRAVNEGSIAFARVPSVLSAACAVAVIVLAARRIVPAVPSLIVALMSAFNPLVIWAAVEMRVYALVLLLGAVLTWTFYEGFIDGKPSTRARIAYTVVAIAALYTQYYLAFLLVAQGLTVIALRRDVLRAYLVVAAIVALAFAPFVPTALVHAHASGEFVLHVGVWHVVHEIADAVFVVVLPHDVTWSGPLKLLGFAVAAVLCLGLLFIGRPALPKGSERAVVVQWIGYLAIFSGVFVVAGAPLDPLKYLIAIAPSSLLVALLAVSSLTRRREAGMRIALAAYAVFTVTAIVTHYRPPFEKPGEWRRLAAMLDAKAGATPIAVFPAELTLPLGAYLTKATISIPRPMPFTLDYVHRMTLVDEAEVAGTLDAVRARSDRLWMVTTGDCSEPTPGIYNYHCRYLEDYLSRHYRLVRSVWFFGSLARLYARSSSVSRGDGHHGVVIARCLPIPWIERPRGQPAVAEAAWLPGDRHARTGPPGS